MISWKLNEEREMVIYYANLLDDAEVKKIIERNELINSQEALHLAEFFWKMVEKSNEIQYRNNPAECEFLLEKIINTFMAYFRSLGFEEEWEKFADL
jgi:hypothetical protein